MDDLERIRELWQDVAEPSPEERRAARARLMEHIEASAGKTKRAPRPAPRRPTRAFVAALAGVVAVCAVAVAALVFDSAGEVPAAQAALDRAARVASSQAPLSGSGADKFLFTRSHEGVVVISMRVGPGVEHSGPDASSGLPNSGVESHPWSFFQPRERESWVAANGEGRMVETRGRARFLSARQREEWVGAGRPPLPGPGPRSARRYQPGELFTVQNLDLPTDPEALREVLESGQIEGLHTEPGAKSILGTIGILLHETYASPELRAALYEVAAQLPGLQLIGSTTDSLGRMGTGVAEQIHGYRHVLIFDPRTAVLLGQRDVVVNPDVAGIPAPPGTVFGYATYSRPKLVEDAR